MFTAFAVLTMFILMTPDPPCSCLESSVALTIAWKAKISLHFCNIIVHLCCLGVRNNCIFFLSPLKLPWAPSLCPLRFGCREEEARYGRVTNLPPPGLLLRDSGSFRNLLNSLFLDMESMGDGYL